ncbi:MAG: D-alanine--D-alanine ligase [Alphaproteobacteria bacterium]|nr:D-alanine--D-alanine ligase [Alphaproteobacteria bacterium]
MRLAALAGQRAREAAERPVSPFEFWPDWLFYAPIVAQWILLGLRHGDMSLPTAANPAIEFGGLCGERKSGILDLLPPPARAVLAPYATLPAGSPAAAEAAMAAAGLSYPVIAKPDIGCNGTGVRLLEDGVALAQYLADFPAGEPLMLQRYIADEGEAGIFYVREPDAPSGRITSLTLKYAPTVVGDGRSSIEALVRADPRAALVPHFYLPRLGDRRHQVPAQGERVRLLLVGNHCKGSIFRDGAAEITPALTRRIEAIARALPDFHFGRFDVRFASLAALRRGEGFTVIEINGVGSEATHVWDARTRLATAWADQLAHYRAAFAIGRAMRARGHRSAGIGAMWRSWRRQRALMARYPAND